MRAVIIKEITRLERETVVLGTKEAVRKSYEARSVFEEEVLKPDLAYKAGLKKIQDAILGLGLNFVVSLRSEAQNFIFRENDVVIIYGEDGAFVNTAKLLQNQNVITVATPVRVCGRLMKFSVDEFVSASKELLNEESDFEIEEVSIAEAVTSLGQNLEAVNDFFIGRSDLRSSRYTVISNSRQIPQISSGVVISTGTGSTGWEKSIRQSYKENWVERSLSDRSVCFMTRELCDGELINTFMTRKSIQIMSSDASCRVIADGVLDDASMLFLPPGAMVIINPSKRFIKLVLPKN